MGVAGLTSRRRGVVKSGLCRRGYGGKTRVDQGLAVAIPRRRGCAREARISQGSSESLAIAARGRCGRHDECSSVRSRDGPSSGDRRLMRLIALGSLWLVRLGALLSALVVLVFRRVFVVVVVVVMVAKGPETDAANVRRRKWGS